jgi:hypothetical protein
MSERPLFLGTKVRDDGAAEGAFELPPHHLVTHGVVLGMTGSGKTGLLMVLVEEALRAKTPVLMIDVKGDLPNLLYLFPSLGAEEWAPWIDEEAARRASKTRLDVAEETSKRWRDGLARDGLGQADVAALAEGVAIRVVTPGATIAEPLDVLSALSRRSALWGVDDEAAHDELSAGLSLLLELAGVGGDPRSREHVVLSALALRRLERGEACPLATLLGDLLDPPVATIGAMPFDEFLPASARRELAQGLNALLASPRLVGWLKGAPLDVASWLSPRDDGRTPAVIVSVAHLDDAERLMVLGLVTEQLLSWVRGPLGHELAARALRLRRDLRLLAATPSEPAHQAPAARAHEAGARVRGGGRARHAEPHGRRLQGALERGRVDHRAPADGRRPGACGRGAAWRRRRPGRARARRARQRAAQPAGAYVLLARRAREAELEPLPLALRDELAARPPHPP